MGRDELDRYVDIRDKLKDERVADLESVFNDLLKDADKIDTSKVDYSKTCLGDNE